MEGPLRYERIIVKVIVFVNDKRVFRRADAIDLPVDLSRFNPVVEFVLVHVEDIPKTIAAEDKPLATGCVVSDL